jgi:hypothetical protein
MPNMFRNFSYPGTDFHEMNLDWLVDMCSKFVGLALNVSGDKLRLVNDKGEVVSSVTVSYAEKALTDKNGKDISTYIFSVAGVGDTVVFTHGDGTTTSVTVPYADKAKYDLTGHELEDYVYNVQIAGDKVRITHGDGTIVDLTIPYAVKASNDANDKAIDTYAASLTVENDNVCLRDSMGRLLNSITVPYATKALNDVDGDAIKSTYAGELTTGTTTVILKAKDGTVLDTITVPYATDASHADEADHATLATDATNAIETVAISGDYMVFTTYGGQAYSIQAPYAVKAQKDDLGNVIKTSYVANVTNDAQTGKLQFRDAMGNIIVELLPTVDTAVHDDYGNAIADYIKTIVVSQNSDYVTVTHGDGDVDTLTIHYSETAWKDTNGNVIKNTYIKYMECVEDVDDGHYKIVCYNGDTPMAELFRFEVIAYMAQCDVNGKALTSYVADVDYNASKQIEVTDGEGNVLKTLANKLGNDADVFFTSLANGDLLTYDAANDIWVNGALQVALDDLYDVTLTNVQDGDVLVYDANAGLWVNQAPTNALANLTDVDLNTLTDGDILRYDANADEWVNTALPSYAPIATSQAFANWLVQSNSLDTTNWSSFLTEWDANSGQHNSFEALVSASDLYYSTQGTGTSQYTHSLKPIDIKYTLDYGGGFYYTMPVGSVAQAVWDGTYQQINATLEAYFPIPCDSQNRCIKVEATCSSGVWGTLSGSIVNSL